MDILHYQADLYAFKDVTEMSMITSTHKQISCFLLHQQEVSRASLKDLCRSVVDYENNDKGRIFGVNIGIFPARLIFPVIVSKAMSSEITAFLDEYNPSTPQQYVHPVLVNLENRKVRHHTGLMFWGATYRRIMNNFVRKYLLPE
jgi:hypothetical protein